MMCHFGQYHFGQIMMCHFGQRMMCPFGQMMTHHWPDDDAVMTGDIVPFAGSTTDGDGLQ